MRAFKCFYNLFYCNIFVHFWFIIFISVFYIFTPPCFFIIWFLMVPYINTNTCNSSIMGLSFTLIASFPIFYWILGVILKYFVASKEFFSFFISSDMLRILLDFCFDIFFYYLDLTNWCEFIFSLNFSCFPSFPFDTLNHFIEYGYFSSVFFYFFLYPLFPFGLLQAI